MNDKQLKQYIDVKTHDLLKYKVRLIHSKRPDMDRHEFRLISEDKLTVLSVNYIELKEMKDYEIFDYYIEQGLESLGINPAIEKKKKKDFKEQLGNIINAQTD